MCCMALIKLLQRILFAELTMCILLEEIRCKMLTICLG